MLDGRLARLQRPLVPVPLCAKFHLQPAFDGVQPAPAIPMERIVVLDHALRRRNDHQSPVGVVLVDGNENRVDFEKLLATEVRFLRPA